MEFMEGICHESLTDNCWDCSAELGTVISGAQCFQQLLCRHDISCSFLLSEVPKERSQAKASRKELLYNTYPRQSNLQTHI